MRRERGEENERRGEGGERRGEPEKHGQSLLPQYSILFNNVI